MSSEARSRWGPRLAIAAGGAVALLMYWALVPRGIPLASRARAAWDHLTDEEGLFAETPTQEFRRRLGACEAHLADLEERLFQIPRPKEGE